MKFVRNGCREKSFFRQNRRRRGEALRESANPSARMGRAAAAAAGDSAFSRIATMKNRPHPTGDGALCRSGEDAIRARLPDGGEGRGEQPAPIGLRQAGHRADERCGGGGSRVTSAAAEADLG
ncbi:hypothetical protein [Cohnella hongkongensis]|uniref:Uncharacterized protein n=1 Tax=Cohnella hongkongensis TaxID=178337 RepID=A0ABV9FF60_9BACL